MALNKKMHPRNPYKKPPSFKELALKNDEFRQHAKIEISGKVTIDFKNGAALRALTRALLKEDWGLDVVLPPEYLVPTLPLRLNYILWLEDLVVALKQDEPAASVYGVDIGTGASCIYPLLAAKKNGWHMIGTEKNEISFNHAQQNVISNGLQSHIKVCKVDGESIIKDTFMGSSFEPNPETFDFTMCNPPFFGSEEELEKTCESRSPNHPRPPPNNARTGSANEVVVEGGEVGFVLKMVDESFEMKDKIRIFSTMLGHKSSVPKVLQYLKEREIHEVASTEFCQGRVTRWGLAWSHVVTLRCESLSADQAGLKQKLKPPLRHEVSCKEGNYDSVHLKIKQLLLKLSMEHKCVIKDASSVGYKVTAQCNTWSNQRRKRRDQLKYSSKEEPCTSQDHNISVLSSSCSTDFNKGDMKDEGQPPLKKAKLAEVVPLVVMGLTLREDQTDESDKEGRVKKVILEMNWLDGSGGRDAVHQIMQYFKNNL